MIPFIETSSNDEYNNNTMFPAGGRRQGYSGRYNPYSSSSRRGTVYRDTVLLNILFMLWQHIGQMERKPPVTIALTLLNVLVFVGVIETPSVKRVCLRPASILYKGEWQRLVYSAFTHADEYHLYYNMASFLYKGSQLEPLYGSVKFALLIGELILTSGLMYIGCALVLHQQWYAPTMSLSFLMGSRNLMNTCAVGFSAVLFGLKVILTHNAPGWSTVWGVSVPTKFVAWLEMVVIQLVTPNASLIGHVCGILAGWLHVLVIKPILYDVSPIRRYRRRRQSQWQGVPRYAS